MLLVLETLGWTRSCPPWTRSGLSLSILAAITRWQSLTDYSYSGIYGYCNCILRTIPWNLQYHQIFYCHVSGCSCLYLCHGNQHNIVPIKHNVSILLFFSCEKLIKCFNSTVYFFFHIGQTFCWIFLQVLLQPIQSWQRDFVELKCWPENKQIGKDLL